MLERLLLPENHAIRRCDRSRAVDLSMRAVICAIAMLLVVPISGQQRGVVRGVAVPKTHAQTGVPVEMTITGTNPCGAVRVDPGDGSERVTHAIRQVPTTV